VRIRLLTAALVAATAATAAPAHAEGVNVKLGLSAGTWAPTGAACNVFVEAGADGSAVLDAAVAAHCIVSYRATGTSFGTYVECIDEVCAEPVTAGTGTYWAMYENGGQTGYGVDGFSADEGDDLTFAYTGYAFV
jgi:hypothetical protein